MSQVLSARLRKKTVICSASSGVGTAGDFFGELILILLLVLLIAQTLLVYLYNYRLNIGAFMNKIHVVLI